ncbi:hypothetical protein B0T26DRAFT_756395 [Lasiosphaeria miniovina]|uniref:Uncharacterized protein n=1 Tax=Lasiosphaeria miniovina TaxID=1954250 RepID=A0AA40DN57_9PEZI|nr:uncharacterized protein B0T26DRAFT_756395 [Lasiosphaeria miniovina]KAK0706987.1 hypothetical protein B0T26DRAFT_756395 [Lasiosphaeria miniovina]
MSLNLSPAVGLYNQIRWVDHDRGRLLPEISRIEHGNAQLESLLRLHSVSDPAAMLGDSAATRDEAAELEARMARVREVQMALRDCAYRLLGSLGPAHDAHRVIYHVGGAWRAITSLRELQQTGGEDKDEPPEPNLALARSGGSTQLGAAERLQVARLMERLRWWLSTRDKALVQ